MNLIIENFKNQNSFTQNNLHGNNILTKIKNYNKLTQKQIDALIKIIPEYKRFQTSNNIVGYDIKSIEKRVNALNSYYDFLDNSFVNGIDEIFTSRGKFRPTVLEEFMYYLFRDLVNDKIKEVKSSNLKLGNAKAYSNLYFTAENLAEFLKSPTIRFNEKDQDFAIYRTINLTIEDKSKSTNLPIISIENKTYLDKTMLEGSIATAEKIKSGNPYSLFFIVTENYDVDLKVDPTYSRINQIYVLRKSKRGKKVKLMPIFSDVVIDLVNNVKYHLERNWSDIENKLTTYGKII